MTITLFNFFNLNEYRTGERTKFLKYVKINFKINSDEEIGFRFEQNYLSDLLNLNTTEFTSNYKTNYIKYNILIDNTSNNKELKYYILGESEPRVLKLRGQYISIKELIEYMKEFCKDFVIRERFYSKINVKNFESFKNEIFPNYLRLTLCPSYYYSQNNYNNISINLDINSDDLFVINSENIYELIKENIYLTNRLEVRNPKAKIEIFVDYPKDPNFNVFYNFDFLFGSSKILAFFDINEMQNYYVNTLNFLKTVENYILNKNNKSNPNYGRLKDNYKSISKQLTGLPEYDYYNYADKSNNQKNNVDTQEINRDLVFKLKLIKFVIEEIKYNSFYLIKDIYFVKNNLYKERLYIFKEDLEIALFNITNKIPITDLNKIYIDNFSEALIKLGEFSREQILILQQKIKEFFSNRLNLYNIKKISINFVNPAYFPIFKEYIDLEEFREFAESRIFLDCLHQIQLILKINT